MHILIPWRKHMQSFNTIGTKLWEELHSQEVPTVYILRVKNDWKMTKFTMRKKVTKNVLTMIPKPHAHPHTMKKTYAKFQNDQYKTVRGVALTRGTHCLYTEGEKWLSSQCGKSDKKCSNNYTHHITCTSSYHEENTRKVSKQSV